MDDVRDAVVELPLAVEALPHGELLSRFYPTTLLVGRTRDGHLISRDNIGRADVAAVFRELGPERLHDFFRHFFELRCLWMDRESERHGRLVQNLQVKDLSGLALAVVLSYDGRRGIALVRQVLSIAINYYPESALKLVVVNAPPFFALVWRAVETVLSERTAKKVRIFGTSGFEDELREHIDADTLDKLGYGGRSGESSPASAADPAVSGALSLNGHRGNDHGGDASASTVGVGSRSTAQAAHGSSAAVQRRAAAQSSSPECNDSSN